jgi:hypothetical protein
MEVEGMRWVTVGAPSQPDVDIVLEPPESFISCWSTIAT